MQTQVFVYYKHLIQAKSSTMKNKAVLFLLFFSSAFAISSCYYNFTGSISGNGDVRVESREVSDFNSVDASNGLHVFITFGDASSLQVEADENLHEIIRTEVESGQLRVYTEKNIRNAKAKNIRITVPSLKEIEVSSAADVKCENVLNTSQIELSASSAGSLRLETNAGEIRVDASSSGSIELRGEVGELDVDVSSAGTVDADRLQAKYVRVSASSAGNASVWALEELKADASSAGNIQYKGEPASRKVETSSAGSVSQR